MNTDNQPPSSRTLQWVKVLAVPVSITLATLIFQGCESSKQNQAQKHTAELQADASQNAATLQADAATAAAQLQADAQTTAAQLQADAAEAASQLQADAAAHTADLQQDQATLALNASYVSTAIQILSQELSAETTGQQRSAEVALRRWATQLLQEHSPVELTEDLATALIQGETIITLQLAPIPINPGIYFPQVELQPFEPTLQPFNAG